MTEANRKMECCNPTACFRNKSEETNGVKHMLDSNGDRKHPCFRHDVCKLECGSTRNCMIDKKLDGPAVNTSDVLEEKFNELKDSIKPD